MIQFWQPNNKNHNSRNLYILVNKKFEEFWNFCNTFIYIYSNTIRFLLSLEYHSNHKTSVTKEGGAHESSKQASRKRPRQSNWLRMYLHAAKWDLVTGSLFLPFLFFTFSMERKSVNCTDGPGPETDNYLKSQ